MEKSGFQKDRQVIPRWRAVDRSDPAELVSHQKLEPFFQGSDEALAFYYSRWQETPSIENATEVMDIAIFAKDRYLAYGPATQIIQHDDVLPSVKDLAYRVLNKPRPAVNDEEDLSTREGMQKHVSSKISQLRKRSHDEPRNALLWLEMARLNSLIGHADAAQSSIQKAYGAAPESRIVLRGMAAFYANLKCPEAAYKKIIQSDVVKTDPWVQSAEVALAGLLGKGSRFHKNALANLRDKEINPKQVSELTAALATEELKSGNNKAARDLFRQSMIDPTENAVAQALWATEKVKVDIDDARFNIDRAFEARAGRCFIEGKFEDAVSHCILWAQDEPYSLRPTIEGSYISNAFLDNHELAIELLKQGLTANPQEGAFRNNAAVAYAKLGKIAEARQQLTYIQDTMTGDNPSPVTIATSGLLDFRSGNIEAGRALYERAVLTAFKQKNWDIAFGAKYHWLYEEVFSGYLDQPTASTLIGFLDDQVKKAPRGFSLTTRMLWKKMKGDMEKRIQNYEYDSPSMFNPSVMMTDFDES